MSFEQIVCIFWLLVLAPMFVLGIVAMVTMPHIDDPGPMPF
ncbi:hypothetical protein [Shinella sp.]|nr:hypothetical protein [Shinella sp.]